MNTKENVDTRSERDPWYSAAKVRLGELYRDLAIAEKGRTMLLDDARSLEVRRTEAITSEAQALLSGTWTQVRTRRSEITLPEIAHRIAVLREAINIQFDDIVAQLMQAAQSARTETPAPRRARG